MALIDQLRVVGLVAHGCEQGLWLLASRTLVLAYGRPVLKWQFYCVCGSRPVLALSAQVHTETWFEASNTKTRA